VQKLVNHLNVKRRLNTIKGIPMVTLDNTINSHLRPYATSAIIESEHVEKYLHVLCRHFSRKVEAQWDTHFGMVKFAMGEMVMKIEPGARQLTISCHASDSDALNTLKSIIDNHVELFGRRESVELIWSH
jgi:hypothetical protein